MKHENNGAVLYSKIIIRTITCLIHIGSFGKMCKGKNLNFDGIPFVILGPKLFECQNGPDHNKALTEKNAKKKGKVMEP